MLPDHSSPILPLICGQAKAALSCAKELERLGVFARAVRPPTVPHNSCQVRLSLRADFSAQDEETILSACEQVLGFAVFQP